jgi:hypothetical protein
MLEHPVERGSPALDHEDAVPMLRWPADADRRRELRAAGRPRLLLVAPDADPPAGWDPLEDWIRTPAEPDDLHARVAAIRRRAAAGLRPGPSVDGDGVLWSSSDWVALAPIEAAVMRVLIARRGAVVPRADLVDAAWPAGTSDPRALDARLKRLRRLIGPLGLTIHTVRSRGYVLDTG